MFTNQHQLYAFSSINQTTRSKKLITQRSLDSIVTISMCLTTIHDALFTTDAPMAIFFLSFSLRTIINSTHKPFKRKILCERTAGTFLPEKKKKKKKKKLRGHSGPESNKWFREGIFILKVNAPFITHCIHNSCKVQNANLFLRFRTQSCSSLQRRTAEETTHQMWVKTLIFPTIIPTCAAHVALKI